MMNEKINEKIALLALKASDPKTGWLDRQKFAKLIIAECAGICYNRDFADGSDYGDAIQTHFGVEE
jgi:hypothetical protein